MPLVDSIIHNIANKLQPSYNDPILCNQYAWWLLEALTGKTGAQLVEHASLKLTSEQQDTLSDWLKKLIDEHFPLQYLLGSVPFNGADILVSPPVLIPRPETEEWTVRLMSKLQKNINGRITILDLCTGTGCIAIALAKALPQATIYASDIEDHALRLAEKNCIRNKTTNVNIIKSDLFESIPKNLKFDLIVGNPPYIAPDEWIELDASVKNWEDKRALVASEHGLKIIAEIIHKAPQFLRPHDDMSDEGIPQLVLEIGFRQAGRVKELLEDAGYCSIEIEKDLEGKDRVACARVVPCGYITNR